jgi:hypothetical protein
MKRNTSRWQSESSNGDIWLGRINSGRREREVRRSDWLYQGSALAVDLDDSLVLVRVGGSRVASWSTARLPGRRLSLLFVLPREHRLLFTLYRMAWREATLNAKHSVGHWVIWSPQKIINSLKIGTKVGIRGLLSWKC